jgi:hypothetical protein
MTTSSPAPSTTPTNPARTPITAHLTANPGIALAPTLAPTAYRSSGALNAFDIAMHPDPSLSEQGGVDPIGLYQSFVSANRGQQLLDQFLRGELPAEIFEGAEGQLTLMLVQDAMQARSNFMNMMSNIMKKQDEVASTIIGNLR